MTDTTTSHEEKVRQYYNDGPGGEGAGTAYRELMGDIWHHGTYEADRQGLSPDDAARAMERRLMDLAGLTKGQRALDFGSGPGGATLNLAEMTGAFFVGVCNTETLNQIARQAAVARQLTDQACFWTIGDHDYRNFTGFPDGSFDAVSFFESVCHLPDKAAFFRAAYRILKPGGRLVGLDWIQRPFGDLRTPEQIDPIINAISGPIRLAGLGTVGSYATMMRAAGFDVTHAQDEWPADVPCWGSTPEEDREQWLTYTNESGTGDLFQRGKQTLDTARGLGVFSVGWFAATRPGGR